jgi:hypothetical protein
VKSSQADLAGVPLAFYDGVIPSLLDGSMVTPINQWEIATPVDPLTALYASPESGATAIAALGSIVPTVKTPTAVAIYGVSGEMILVSTPARRTVPAKGAPAQSASFAWARIADFSISSAAHSVMVDNGTSVISIIDRAGAVSASEVARLGTPQDPTPAATSTYIESIYSDPVTSYTRGNPISLTGAHSSTLVGFGGNSALNAIHYYPSGGNSHGCVRVSAAMTHSLSTLPVGTPVIFN